MENDTFIFLKEEFKDIYKECKEMEELILDGRYDLSLFQARKSVERIVDTIYKLEPKIKIKSDFDLNTKIRDLQRRHKITYEISNDMHEIRKIGNVSAHDKNELAQQESFRLHQLLFNITKFFYEKYSLDLNINRIKPYSGLKLNKDKDYDEILKRIKELEEKNKENKDMTNDAVGEEKDFKYKYHQVNGSFLHGELLKLSNSSQESVEGYENLSTFKNYLHVDRDIQEELYSKLMEANNDKSNKLIMLCGSVGDGKSHLLSYFNQKYPELMKNFETINDATESSDPRKTSIDRLASKLSDFNDENINKTNKKILLLINLGVLNNFIDSKYASTEFRILSKILKDLNIFDVNDFRNNFEKDPVSIISFSDNNLFEFDTTHKYNVYSRYMSELFSKITIQTKDNPFYNAFCKDLENKINTPILFNFHLFSLKEVQNIIIDNLIKIIIKYKKIISTRELLNFIYEIIVPSNHKTYGENDSLINYMDVLLPNLLFNSTDRCEILQYINYEDPVFKRSDTIDQLLMDLNVSEDSLNVLTKYMNLEKLDFLMSDLNSTIIIKNLDYNERKTVITSIIRFLNIFGKPKIIDLFTKESYKNYVNYLMAYNNNNIGNLRHLKTEIESAIFNWKGKIHDNYICVENLSKFKIAKQFDIKLQDIDKGIKERNNNNINRFKTSILLKFTVNNSDTVDLNLDYPLYEVITKLNKGYKPNKSEQKNLLLFNEFIDKLIKATQSDDYLIYNILENKKFKLKNEFGYYVFERA